MTDDTTPSRAARIAAARAALARRHAEAPDAVQRFNARMARLAAAEKRERERFDYLVMGKDRPSVTVRAGKRHGRRKGTKVVRPIPLSPGIEEAVQLRDRWSHKRAATAQTMEAATNTHQGALAQLYANGTIDAEQLEWAAQISNVHRSIEADVGVKVASLEARVDSSRRSADLPERIHRVRMHAAYGFWRHYLPAPKGLVLDMIVGDAIGYTVAAVRYRVHNRKAKRLLLEAIQRWPLCVVHAFSAIDEAMVEAMNRAERPLSGPIWPMPVAQEYDRARSAETGREKTDEPYLLPPIDPAFLDERGLFRSWDEIAGIIRERVNAQ